MARSLILVTLYLVCALESFLLKNAMGQFLSYHCSQLNCGGISVYLKVLCKVRVGQY
jgi:hypothetical protein